MTLSKLLQTIIFTTAVLLLAGCQPKPYADGRNHSEQFLPEEEPTAESQLLQAQFVRGAGADATLYPCHFKGGDLNSLGATKLDLMLRDNGPGQLAVWMAVPDDDQAAARRMSVAAYLKDHGLPPEQITFGRGSDPASGYPAAQGLKDLAALDASNAGSAPGGAATPTAGAPTGGGSTPGSP